MEVNETQQKNAKFKKLRMVFKAIWTNGIFRKTLGIILILIGIGALITPLTPGSWLILIGLGLMGYKAKWFLKLKSHLKRYWSKHKDL